MTDQFKAIRLGTDSTLTLSVVAIVLVSKDNRSRSEMSKSVLACADY